MRTFMNSRRWQAGLLLATMATTAIAPLAEAGHANWRRFRGPACETRVIRQAYHPSYGYLPHARDAACRSDGGGVIAGFVGGLFLGATLANAAPARVAYWDPYCHEGFPSLEVYVSHCRAYHHARTVTVIQVPDGYDWDDYHYCDDCGDYYWGDAHDCDD